MKKRILALVAVVAMAFTMTSCITNGALTAMAMLRYNIRQSDPEPHSQYDTFIDTHYPDVRIETRWPNMIVVEKNI